MKSLFAASVLAAFLLPVAAPSDDAAAQQPKETSKFFSTRVQGELRVPGPPGGALAGFGCGNITVVATSKDLGPHAPNEFGTPKWVRTANASGTYASGTCAFSIFVVPGSAFYLSAGGHGHFECTSINASLPSIGPISVPLAQTRTVNGVISRITCEVLH